MNLLICLMLLPNKKVTEWEITNTEVVNEIKNLYNINKFYTRQQREEGAHC